MLVAFSIISFEEIEEVVFVFFVAHEGIRVEFGKQIGLELREFAGIAMESFLVDGFDAVPGIKSRIGFQFIVIRPGVKVIDKANRIGPNGEFGGVVLPIDEILLALL